MMNDAILYARYSTPAQLIGDSEHRQDSMADGYAGRHGLDIVRRYYDRGVTGWRGKNSTEGELRQIIDDAERGVIRPATVLLVENFDRLSRLPISKALELFTRLLNLGLVVVDLTTEHRYVRDSLDNLVDHIVSVLHMSRANEESNRKSGAVRKAKAAKRERARAGDVKLTEQGPYWLKARRRGDQITFEPIAGRVRIIEEIFALCIAGYGRRLIADTLNRRGVPAFRGKHGWHYASVAAILRSPRVIGIFQPTQVIAGSDKRQPVGEPIVGYYPAVVSEATFWQAQEALARRRDPHAAGRHGATFSNLLRGMVRCGDCGGPLVIVSHASHRDPVTKLRRRTKFLACDGYVRKTGCTNRRRHPHAKIEEDMIQLLSWFDLSALLGPQGDPDVGRGVEIEGAIAGKRAEADRLIMAFGADGSATAKRRIHKLDEEIEALEAELEAHQRRVQIAEANRGRDEYAEFRALVARLDNEAVSEADQFLIRAKLHQEMKRRVDGIIADGTSVKAYLKTRGAGAVTVSLPLPATYWLGEAAWALDDLRRPPPVTEVPIEEAWSPEELAEWKARS